MDPERQPLEGIAAADSHLGRPVPLPAAALPLARWVEVHADGAGAVDIEFNLDDTREGAPGRLALYVSTGAPPAQFPPDTPAESMVLSGLELTHRSVELAEAQPSLRPVHELAWSGDGLHFRLTGQGPWRMEDLLAIAASVCVGGVR